MELIYWKVVLRYGHVGKRNAVTVARYLVTPHFVTIVKVSDFARTMPGVKSNGVVSITQVNEREFTAGKIEESENFYVQNLKQTWSGEAV